ncbi:Clathrin/coatomer adaptor, adaptin-like, N-terminal [Dillenia turbinata]|uniref:AP-3 complex subunit delta n=1 Tax=Dillenia turbinata TaxID=194707 RepID=A0AAN8V0D2_9MAGN
MATTASSFMDSLFQRTLDDLIKGLRHNLIGEQLFISKSLEDIRKEIKSTDLQTKSIALEKLTYLSSIHGIDMSWAAFHAVEIMSSSRFSHKKIGYLAASLSFNESTEVLLLITNQLRKDLSSTNEFEVNLALECLSVIATIDLARDLTPELFTLLSSSKVYVRKKAIAVIFKVFEKYQDSVGVCFKRLVENLEGSDGKSMSAAVGVFCELAAKDPRAYLPLAPEFYRILVDCRNNWVLIKVLKIFASLAPLEPRLAKRIVEPICELMRKTGAKSLLFECIRTVVTSLGEYESAVRLAVSKTREFLSDDDSNLKYLGLQALTIMGPKHLWAILENKEVVIKSLSDTDSNVKLAALRLVMTMVSEDNVIEICRVLLNYSLKSDPEFCNEILSSILFTCSRNFYEIIVDFDWYVSLLGEMSRIPNCQKGEEIESQLIDICLRVEDARPELVRVGRDLVIDPALLGNPFLHGILSAAAWVSGEYVEFAKSPFELLEALLQPRTNLLPSSVRSVYIQSSFKVLVFCLHSYLLNNEAHIPSSSPEKLASGVPDTVLGDGFLEASVITAPKSIVESEHDADFSPGASNHGVSVENDGEDVIHGQTSLSVPLEKDYFTRESIIKLLDMSEMALGPLLESHEVEIQERSRNVIGLIELIKQEITGPLVKKETDDMRDEFKALNMIRLICDGFSEELGPVPVTAQERVPVPEGLTLVENLCDLDTIFADMNLLTQSSLILGTLNLGETTGGSLSDLQTKDDLEPATESTSLLSEHRKRHGLYYLPSEKSNSLYNAYPPANDSLLQQNENDHVDDLVKLTEQSLVPKKKPSHAKPRPVVVKLDEGDVPITSRKLESEENLLSGAVRDALLGNEDKSTSAKVPCGKSSSKRIEKGKQSVDVPSESNDNAADKGKADVGKGSSRRSKGRGKERKHKSGVKGGTQREGNGQRENLKSSRTSKHKTHHGAVDSVNVIPQTPVIPDFLL